MLTCMAADPETPAPARDRVVVGRNAVACEGTTWLICPVKGFDCGRVPLSTFGEQWAQDVIAVHVGLHHRHWH
jgi:hypothetical protein